MIDKINNCKCEFDIFLEKFKKDKKKVIIFGTGEFGKIVFNELVNKGIEIECFCDNDKNKIGQILYNRKIYSYEETMEKFEDLSIVMASSFYKEINEKIKKSNDQRKIYNFAKNCYVHKEMFYYKYNFIEKNKSEVEFIYNNLADEKSKETFIDLINHRISADMKYIERIKVDKEIYFDDEIINIRDIHNILDVGAFTGDTLLKYLKEREGIKEQYIAMEPEKNNFYKLGKLIKDRKIENVEIVNLGAWNSKEKLNFSGNELEKSRIEEDGEEYIYVDKIDSIVRKRKIDFIKMDIEGAELEALQGAKNTIIQNKPILAISVYHKKEDLINIPLFIKELCKEYKLYIRHYGEFCYDTVCYAVADKKELR